MRDLATFMVCLIGSIGSVAAWIQVRQVKKKQSVLSAELMQLRLKFRGAKVNGG